MLGKLPMPKAIKHRFIITEGSAQMPVAIRNTLSILFSIPIMYQGFWLPLNLMVGSLLAGTALRALERSRVD